MSSTVIFLLGFGLGVLAGFLLFRFSEHQP